MAVQHVPSCHVLTVPSFEEQLQHNKRNCSQSLRLSTAPLLYPESCVFFCLLYLTHNWLVTSVTSLFNTIPSHLGMCLDYLSSCA